MLNLSTSRVTEDLARQRGCPVSRTPVGEINVVERMIAAKALFGGEGNGGVIDPRIGYVRDSFAAIAQVLDLMAASGEPVSQLVADLPRYTMIKEPYPISLAAGMSPGSAEVSALWDRIAAGFPDARVDRRDGLRLEWDDGWVHVRASNTEPIVRVIAESVDPEDAPRPDSPDRPLGQCNPGVSDMNPSECAQLSKPPSVAFVDVDGTLLAQTTTFLFARVLYRKGWIRRSFFFRHSIMACSIASGDSTTGG